MVVMFGIGILDVEAHRRVEALLGQKHILGTPTREMRRINTCLRRSTHSRSAPRARTSWIVPHSFARDVP